MAGSLNTCKKSVLCSPAVKLETAFTRFPSNRGSSMFTMATANALKLAKSNSHKSGHRNFQNSLKSNLGCDFLSFFAAPYDDDDLWLNFKPQFALEIFDLTTSAPTARRPVYLRKDQCLPKKFGFCSKSFQMCKAL